MDWSKTFVIMLSIMLLAVLAQAATVHVPGDYATIQQGINAASDNDTVLVAANTYTGSGNKNLDFKGKEIIVTSEQGAELTIIDCQGAGRGFHFHSGETSSSVLSGFSIVNGATVGDHGGGISCVNASSPTIENNIIRDNSAQTGGGISCNRSSPFIVNNEIRDNISAEHGGGISCANSSSPVIENNNIRENLANLEMGGGGIFSDQGSSPEIRGNEIVENYSGRRGGGICCTNSSTVIIENNLIKGNTAGSVGGGISCNWNSNATIKNNEIVENRSSNNGGGIHFLWSSPDMQDNVIRKNISDQDGGGIFCDPVSSPSIKNTEISKNEAKNRGGGILCNGSAPAIINSTISENTSGKNGSGLYCQGSAHPTVLNTILWGDNPGEIHLDAKAWIDITYSDIQDGWAGAGNIDSDPLFVDPANSNYHLQSNSPCSGKGQMTQDVPTADIEDNSRPNPSGSGSDMGAYENLSGDILPISMALSTTELDFGVSNTQDSFTITNPESGTLDWEVNSHIPEWLEISPDSGTVFAGSSSDISVIVSRENLAPGAHEENIVIASNGGNTSISISITVILNDGVMFRGHFYKVISQEMSWHDVKTYAESLGAHLVTINNDPENRFVCDLVTDSGITDRFWIGLTDEELEGDFRWGTDEPLAYTNWDVTEPNNLINEDHVEVMPNNRLWNDVFSGGARPFVLEFESVTVDNLTALPANTENSIQLNWTSPEATDSYRLPVEYVIRYNQIPVTESNWNESTDINGEPIPGIPGTEESQILTMPNPGIPYYFAIKTRDEMTNISHISNSPCARSAIQLSEGWNNVAFMAYDVMPLGDAILSISDKIMSIWGYNLDTGEWLRFFTTGPVFLNNLEEMIPGWAYWILTTQECIWKYGALSAQASPSAVTRKPPLILYGKLSSGYSTEEHNSSVVSFKAENVDAGRYIIGSEPGYGNHYVLEISLDNNYRSGNTGHIYVDDICIRESIKLGGMGSLMRFDISYMQKPGFTRLLQNYPNPFNPETWIPFQLSTPAEIKINIYSASGILIKTLDLGYKQAGYYMSPETSAYWDGKDMDGERVASGMLFYSIQTGKYAETRKMILIK